MPMEENRTFDGPRGESRKSDARERPGIVGGPLKLSPFPPAREGSPLLGPSFSLFPSVKSPECINFHELKLVGRRPSPNPAWGESTMKNSTEGNEGNEG